MRVRPWPIVIIACVCILAPLFNAFYSAGLVQKNLIDYFRVILEYRPVWELGAWFVLPFLVGISILAFNNWSYYLFLGFMCLVMFLTYDQWQMYPEKFSFALMVLSQFANMIVIAYFLHPSVRIIYFEPQIRWWQQKPRFVCDIQGTLKVKDSQSHCHIRNVSEGGVLLSTDTSIPENTAVILKFNLLECDVEALGKSVHKGKDGYGIMFQEIRSDLKVFKHTMKSLHQHGFKPRVETQPWTASLKDWFITFLKTGKGLIPKTDQVKKS